MGLEIFLPEISGGLPVQHAGKGARSGFPSPARDYIAEAIDLNKELIRHPASTFYGRVVGDSMIEEGIDEGDILVIDKSLEPEDGDFAVCCIDGEFTLKRIRITGHNTIMLVSSNRSYRPVEVTEDNEFIVWGIVVYTIKRIRRRHG